MPETELPKYLEGWCKIASLGAKHKLLSACSNVQLEHKALTTKDRALQSAKNTVKEILALRCSTFMQSFKWLLLFNKCEPQYIVLQSKLPKVLISANPALSILSEINTCQIKSYWWPVTAVGGCVWNGWATSTLKLPREVHLQKVASFLCWLSPVRN